MNLIDAVDASISLAAISVEWGVVVEVEGIVH